MQYTYSDTGWYLYILEVRKKQAQGREHEGHLNTSELGQANTFFLK